MDELQTFDSLLQKKMPHWLLWCQETNEWLWTHIKQVINHAHVTCLSACWDERTLYCNLPPPMQIHILSPICSVWAEAMHLYLQRSYDREQHNLSVLLCYSTLRRGIVFCMLRWEFEVYMMNAWLNELKRRWGMMCKKSIIALSCAFS